MYYFKLLLIISLRLITSLIPIFCIQPFLNVAHKMKLYHQFFLKLFDEKRFVNLVNVFLASKRSMNPMKKYPHIVESYACILKIFVVIDKERSINALISFGICSTPKESK